MIKIKILRMQIFNLNTSTKIFLATLAYRVVSFMRSTIGKSDNLVINRKKILWNLDLKEGIDFSIYILGEFEKSTFSLYKSILREGDVVLDVGANIGDQTLPIAKLIGPTGKVFAFEPTEYAFNKLTKMLSMGQ